jgi:hypothetical protein
VTDKDRDGHRPSVACPEGSFANGLYPLKVQLFTELIQLGLLPVRLSEIVPELFVLYLLNELLVS